MTDLLVALGLFAVIGVVVTLKDRAWARRTTQEIQAGSPVDFAVRVAGDRPPYPPPRSRSGLMLRDRLHVGPAVLRVELAGGGGTLDLAGTGLRVIRQRLRADDEHGRADEDVLVCTDGTGAAVTLFVDSGSAELVWAALDARPLPSAPQPARLLTNPTVSLRALAPVAVLALGAVAGLLTALALTTAVPVRTTVLSLDQDERCRVAWTDPRDGVRHRSIVDCVEGAGRTTTIYTLAGPLRGAALDSDTPWLWSGGSALLLIGGGVWTWRTRRRRGNPDDARPLLRVRPPGAALARDPLHRSDLTWQTLSTLALHRAEEEGWGPGVTPPLAERAMAARGRTLVELATSAAWALLLPALAVLAGWTAYAGVLAGFGPVTRVEARITGQPEGFVPLSADDLPIRFTTASGRDVVTLVAVRGLPDPAPATLPIEYSDTHPERVRALEHAGHVFGASTSTAVILLDLGVAGAFVVAGLRRRRAEAAARASGENHEVRYALALGSYGELMMLVFTAGQPDARPAWMLPLDPRVRHAVPPSGRATLHGRLDDDARVAVSVDGRPLRTDGPLLYAHAEAVLHLLNGSGPEDD